MWTLIRLATRNVTRNRARTALTLAAIGFGVLMAVFLGGFAQGFTNALADDTILGKAGAIQIHKAGYNDMQDASPLDFDMPQGGEIEQKVRAIPGVAEVTPRLMFQALLNAPGATSMIVIQAVDPAHEYTVLPRSKADIVGNVISDETPSGAVIGIDLASALGLVDTVERQTPKGTVTESHPKKGASGTLSAARKGGQQNALDIDVTGIIAGGDPFSNKRLGYVSLAFAQDLLDMKGRVNEFFVSVVDRDDVPKLRDQIAATLGPGYEVQTWQQARPDAADRIGFLRGILVFVCGIFLVIVVIGVVNTMLMSVMERTREIGTMMAVGVKRIHVTVLFLLEGFTLALIGGVGGALGGLVIVVGSASTGGFYFSAPGASKPWQILPNAPLPLVALAVGASLVGTLVASAYPAWRASRLRPVEALRAL